jgi:hypothetical protein
MLAYDSQALVMMAACQNAETYAAAYVRNNSTNPMFSPIDR